MVKQSATSKMKNKITFVNGIKFLSKMEADFYLFLLKSYAVEDIVLQPKFLLQPMFKKNGNTHHSITYIADFQIKSKGLIFDCKGQKTIHFILKYKMFEYKHPDLHLTLITKTPLWLQHTYGAWITLEDLTKERKIKNKLTKTANK